MVFGRSLSVVGNDQILILIDREVSKELLPVALIIAGGYLAGCGPRVGWIISNATTKNLVRVLKGSGREWMTRFRMRER
jgi:hypothetical protein